MSADNPILNSPYVEPPVNALKDKYEYPEWHFIEVANDIRNIKNQLIEKISSL
jgi:type III restriction enzyme